MSELTDVPAMGVGAGTGRAMAVDADAEAVAAAAALDLACLAVEASMVNWIACAEGLVRR